MKIKSAKLSFFVLGALLILSFAFFSYAEDLSVANDNIFLDSDQDGLSDAEEKTYGTDPNKYDTDGDSYSDGMEIKTGYNPLLPAPGDRVMPENEGIFASDPSTAASKEENITEEVTDRINKLIAEKEGTTDKEILMSDVRSLVEETIKTKAEDAALPEIAEDEIKVKEQDYAKLPPEEQAKRKKEDFMNYATAASYVISSNSPQPITTADDLTSMTGTLSQQISSALLSRNPKVLDDLATSGEKTLDQLKYIEVPQEMVPLHTKGLIFSKYAMQLKNSIAPDPDDPVGEIVNLSKIQGLAQSFLVFGLEMQTKASEYGVSAIENDSAASPAEADSATAGTDATQ